MSVFLRTCDHLSRTSSIFSLVTDTPYHSPRPPPPPAADSDPLRAAPGVGTPPQARALRRENVRLRQEAAPGEALLRAGHDRPEVRIPRSRPPRGHTHVDAALPGDGGGQLPLSRERSGHAHGHRPEDDAQLPRVPDRGQRRRQDDAREDDRGGHPAEQSVRLPLLHPSQPQDRVREPARLLSRRAARRRQSGGVHPVEVQGRVRQGACCVTFRSPFREAIACRVRPTPIRVPDTCIFPPSLSNTPRRSRPIDDRDRKRSRARRTASDRRSRRPSTITTSRGYGAVASAGACSSTRSRRRTPARRITYT